MNTFSPSPSATALAQSSPIRISELSPSLDDSPRRYICAVVTLLWPFSSSTKSFSLLLSDPDFRLRRLNGQVKATFQGSGAEAVAHSKVGIGDTVILCLDGVEWISQQAEAGTPGKTIPWDLHFKDRVVLEVYRDSHHLYTVEHDTPLPSDTQAADSSTQSSSAQFRLVDGERTGVSVVPNQWSSPAFSRRSRQSLGPLSVSTFDPFAEEDGYVAGKGRKRTRFSRLSSEWTFAETSPSPTKTTTWDPFEDLDIEVSKDFESRATGSEQDTEPISDGVSDARASSTISPTPNGPQIEIVESAPDSNVSDTRDSGVQDASAHKIVVQSEEQEVSAVHSGADNRDGVTSNVGVRGTDLSNNAPEHMGSTPPHSSVDEWASSIAIADAAATEPDVAESHATDTPRLRPVGSPGLPLVSPLNTRSGTPIGDIHEYENVSGDVAPEERTFSTSQDVEMTDADLHTYHRPLSQQPTELSESPQPVKLQDTLYDQAVDHGAENVELQGLATEVSEGEVENPDSQEVVPTVFMKTAESFSSREQQFEQTLDVTDDDIVESGQSERDSGSMSPSRQDTEIRVDEEVLSGSDESGKSSEDIEEYSEDDYDQAEIAQEKVESDQDSPSTDDDGSQVSDGEYDLDDAAPPAVFQTQSTAMVSHDEVVVLDTDEESPSSDGNESIERDEMESPRTDVEEQSEEGDMETTRDSGWLELSQSYIFEPEETMGAYETAEYERESEVVTDAYGEPTELFPQPPNGAVDVSVPSPRDNSREVSPRLEESGREVYYKSPSFSPSTRGGSISEKESPEEEAIDPQLFRMQNSEPPQSSPQKKRPSGLSLDGPSSSPPHGPRENPLMGGRSSSFLKDQPLTPVASQEVVFSPSQQLQFSLDVFPTLPTPQASQDITAAKRQQDTIATETRGRNESSIEGRIKILKNQPDVEAQREEKAQPELESKPEVELETEHDNKATVGTLSQSEFRFAEERLPEAQNELHPLESETEIKTQLERESEAAGESDSDVSASQPKASTSPDTNLAPEILDGADKGKESEVVQNGQQGDIKNNEISPSKDSTSREIVDPSFLSPYPAKIPKMEPNRHATGLRTTLSYYAPLSPMVDHFNSLIDTLSIVISASQPIRATSGARDYYTTIQVTDGSLGGRTTSAQIFRRYKRAIPRPIEGDVILLRDFKVCAFNHSMMLQAVKSSSWAVFDQGKPDSMRCTGPPVEVGDGEKKYVTELRKLYTEGAIAASERGSIPTSRASTGTFSTASSESGATDNRTRRGSTPRRSRRGKSSRSRRITIHELRHGRRYTDVGSGSDKDSIHELRDGTLYMNP